MKKEIRWKRILAAFLSFIMLVCVIGPIRDVKAAVPTETEVSGVNYAPFQNGGWNIVVNLSTPLEGVSDVWEPLTGLTYSVNDGETQPLTMQIGGNAGVVTFLPSADVLPEDVAVGTKLTIQAGTAMSSDESTGITFAKDVTLVRTKAEGNLDWKVYVPSTAELTVTGIYTSYYETDHKWYIFLNLDKELSGWTSNGNEMLRGVTCSVGDGEAKTLPVYTFTSSSIIYFTVNEADWGVGQDTTDKTLTLHCTDGKYISLADGKTLVDFVTFTEPVVLSGKGQSTYNDWEMEDPNVTKTSVSVVPTAAWTGRIWNLYLELTNPIKNATEEDWTDLAGLTYSINGGEVKPLPLCVGGKVNQVCLMPTAEDLPQDVSVETTVTVYAGTAKSNDGSKGIKLAEPVTLIRVSDVDQGSWILKTESPSEEEDGHLGDPIKDGNRTSADLVTMIRTIKTSSEDDLYCVPYLLYDVSLDDKVDEEDLSCMREVLVGKRELSLQYSDYAQIELAAFMSPPAYGGTYEGTTEFPDGYNPTERNYLTLQNFLTYKKAGFNYMLAEGIGEAYKTPFTFASTERSGILRNYMGLAKEVGLPVIIASDLQDMTTKTFQKDEVHVDRTDNTLSDYDKSYIAAMLKDMFYRYGSIFKGIRITDEPTVELADIYTSIIDYSKSILPNVDTFVCNRPINSKEFQITGAGRVYDEELYKEYIRAFANATGTFVPDFYPLMTKAGETSVRQGYYRNYELVAQDAKANNYDAGVVIQSSSWGSYYADIDSRNVEYYRKASKKADIGFQVYSALAYGAKNITYYTYWEHTHQYDVGYVYDAMVMFPDNKDDAPVITDTYYAAQAVNQEIKKFDHVFLKYDWDGSIAVPKPGATESTLMSEVDEYDYRTNTCISSVSATDDALIGCMKDKDNGNKEGFFIVNATDPGKTLSSTVAVNFGTTSYAICYVNGEETIVKPDSSGNYTFDLSSGEGIFVIPEQ